MQINYLLPNYLKKIGWIILSLGLLGAFFISSEFEFFNTTVFAISNFSFLNQNSGYFQFIENNIFDELVSICLILGVLFITFSKEKIEDEFISKIRLESLVWAIYINYIILIFLIIFIYDMAFLKVLLYNMFTVLLFFIIRFKWVLYQSKKQINNEK